MKYIILTGALKNVGDFLIAERSKQLIRHHKGNVELIDILRYHSLENILEEVNTANAVILAGGPGYRRDMYPQVFSLVKYLDEIKIPIICMGMGGHLISDQDKIVYGYAFNDSSKMLLTRSANDYILGTRDYITSKILKNNGFNNVLMTGCPAWYDVNYIEKQYTIDSNVEKIVFSNPANIRNIPQAILVMELLKRKYYGAKIYCTFHRGIEADKYTSLEEARILKMLQEQAHKMGIETIDISYNLDNMRIYDECDLHVGYRVHAHIYCTSHYKKSILIEEDSRGKGVNAAMGLQSIQAWEDDTYKSSSYTVNNLAYYIDELKQSHYRQLESSYISIKNHYNNMKIFLSQMP